MPPNPYWAGSKFLAWLSKQGRKAPLSECETKWELHNKNCPTDELKDCSLDDYINYLGKNLIRKERRSYGYVIKLTKYGVDWAAEWAIHYNESRGNHGGLSLNRY